MTDDIPDLSLVVPCYDEEDSLPRLLDALGGWLEGLRAEVVLVDDGSTDATARILAQAVKKDSRMRALTHPVNRGVGAAMRTGFHASRGRIVVCYDADMTYPLADVHRLADRLDETGADVVSASPFVAQGRADGVGPFRLLLSRAAAFTHRLVLGRRGRQMATFTCAFRAYRGGIARGIVFDADGFPAAAEMLGRLLLAGARVIEFPSVLSVRTAGVSHLRVVPTALGHLGVLAKLLRWHPPRRRPPPRPRDERPSPTRAEVAAQNVALPMRLLAEHGNPVVRLVEARRQASLVRLCRAAPDDRILDVGAEEGHLSTRLAATGMRVVRLDLDPEMLRDGPGAAVAADAQRLPFRRGVFDRVLLSAVLEHVPAPRRAASEAVRVLRPGGRAVVSVPDDGLVLTLKRLARALGPGLLLGPLSPGLAPGHLRIYSPARLRRHLAGRVRALVRDPLGLSFHAVVEATR